MTYDLSIASTALLPSACTKSYQRLPLGPAKCDGSPTPSVGKKAHGARVFGGQQDSRSLTRMALS